MSDQVAESPAAETPPPKGIEINFVKEFMSLSRGRWVVFYAGLLHLAHERGLIGIETELLQYPSEENGQTAICRARVTIDQGGKVKGYTGIGDANPGNVANNMKPHIIRMAETRAKARALRDAVDVGVAALEELADADEGTVNQAPRVQTQTSTPPSPNGKTTTPTNGTTRPQGQAASARPYVQVKVGESTYNLPKAIADLNDEGLARDYIDLRGPMAAATTMNALAAAWGEIGKRREAMPGALYRELAAEKDALKSRLEARGNVRR